MKQHIAHALVILFLTSPLTAADEQVFSGPQPGEKLSALKVVGVYDDLAAKEIDFVKHAGGKPTLIIFMHKLTRPGAAVMRTMTQYAASLNKPKPGTVAAYVVWLQDDKAKADAYLNRARKSLQINVPLGISVNGAEGPGAYGLNRNVEMTLLVAEANKVTANFALVQPSVTDTPKMAAALAKLIDAKPPTQEQLNKLAYPKGNMRGKPSATRGDNSKDKSKDKGDGAKRQPVDPALGSLLRAVIQKDATAEQVTKAAEAVEKYVGDDAQKRATVHRISGVIIDRRYGTEAARKQAKLWQEKYKRSK